MELLLYAVIFSMILIASNATNKLVPSLPLPLLQILLGIGWALFIPEENFHLDTELFLALVIGPLLFREAEEADITSVLKHWRIILYLIFPVIFISTISLGWAAHSLWLPLPLAACMAVGAALGPTDLVAFASLSERFTFPKRVSNILKGEGLLNDASGLVAFRVALTALATGSFSLGEAGVSLGISIIGGFAVGILTAFVNRWLQKLLLSVRASDIASELILELSLPLLTFFLAEELHVSGIIAVVVSGILKASRFKRITLLEARVDTVSHTVWNTVNFILNGSVFVILGMELEMIAKPILSSPIYNNLLLVVSVFLLTTLLFLIRFVMVYLFYWFRTLRLKKSVRNYLKDALLLTFSGVKGTVSIATILLIPTKIEIEYPILLFLVAGVTLVSFITGLMVLPKLSEDKEETNDYLMQIAILNYVVTQVSVHYIKAVYKLLEWCEQSVILADLGYLNCELKEELKQNGYHLWTPLRQNMEGAKQPNYWKLIAMRRTIETRISELCSLFDMKRTLARGMTRLQLWIKQIILAYNLRYFEIN